MTDIEFREIERAIGRDETEIRELEEQIRHLRAKVRVRRDCRAVEYGARMARRESESSAA